MKTLSHSLHGLPALVSFLGLVCTQSALSQPAAGNLPSGYTCMQSPPPGYGATTAAPRTAAGLRPIPRIQPSPPIPNSPSFGPQALHRLDHCHLRTQALHRRRHPPRKNPRLPQKPAPRRKEALPPAAARPRIASRITASHVLKMMWADCGVAQWGATRPRTAPPSQGLLRRETR